MGVVALGFGGDDGLWGRISGKVVGFADSVWIRALSEFFFKTSRGGFGLGWLSEFPCLGMSSQTQHGFLDQPLERK